MLRRLRPPLMEITSAIKALRSLEVLKGVSGLLPGSEPLYLAICNLSFDSIDSFSASMMPAASRIMGDISNFTNSPPVVQINEVLP